MSNTHDEKNCRECELPILNAYDEPCEVSDPPKPLDFADLLTLGTTFTSNAMRSEKKLPYWRFPKRAMVEWAKRFKKGEKYDIAKGTTHNWKLAIHSTDVEFVRQFFDHAIEHMFNAKDLAHTGAETPDWEGESMVDHLGAALWNIASLIEYLDKNPELVCKALSQIPTVINNEETLHP